MRRIIRGEIEMNDTVIRARVGRHGLILRMLLRFIPSMAIIGAVLFATAGSRKSSSAWRARY